jgi:hypothetical protein
MNISHAVFSPCRLYRYTLFRDLGMQGPTLTVVMLNPSTADAVQDDPTIRRVIGFAKAIGSGAVSVLNLFAVRATDPRAMLSADDPVGPRNDEHLTQALELARDEGRFVLAAWGAHGGHCSRDFHVMHRLGAGVEWRCLGRTHRGFPRHPLYVSKAQVMVPFVTGGGA